LCKNRKSSSLRQQSAVQDSTHACFWGSCRHCKCCIAELQKNHFAHAEIIDTKGSENDPPDGFSEDPKHLHSPPGGALILGGDIAPP
jgi:hypothetical protein